MNVPFYESSYDKGMSSCTMMWAETQVLTKVVHLRHDGLQLEAENKGLFRPTTSSLRMDQLPIYFFFLHKYTRFMTSIQDGFQLAIYLPITASKGSLA